MSPRGRDSVRQGLTVFGAIFQVAAGIWSGDRAGDLANELWTPVLPAGYAFLIWTPIFLLTLIYAGWQALPSNRERALPRRIGWPLAIALIGNGIWEVLFPLEQFLLAQLAIIGIFISLAVAAVRLAQYAATHELAGPEPWLVALPLGLYFGWITAAMCVGMATTLTAYDLGTDSQAAVIIGTVLLLIGAGLATGVILYRPRPPRIFTAAYGAAVIWALVAVTANHLDAAPPITAVLAGLIAAGVLLLLIWRLGTSGGVRRPVLQA